jgi:hypothetical protein
VINVVVRAGWMWAVTRNHITAGVNIQRLFKIILPQAVPPAHRDIVDPENKAQIIQIPIFVVVEPDRFR